MAQFSTDYTPAGIVTTTSAPPMGGQGGIDPHLGGIMDQIIQMKLENAKRQQIQQQLAQQRQDEARIAATRGSDTYAKSRYGQFLDRGGLAPQVAGGQVGGGNGGEANGTPQQRMQYLAFQDAANQVAAKSGRAPTRMVTGANVIPGATVDPLAMSGYDRELYMPKNSSFQQ